jgi:hypothetical protein
MALEHRHLPLLFTLPATLLLAVSAGDQGLWIAAPRGLMLWDHGHVGAGWPWPKVPYPPPAGQWPRGAAGPPNRPPVPRLAAAPDGQAVVGYGFWVGVAQPWHPGR